MDDFGVEYIGIEHFNFLLELLKKFNSVQCNMAGDKLAGIVIQWDYPGKCCRLSMPGYIDNLLLKFKHPHPLKPRLSPYTCLPISYGTKTQFLPDEDISELLDDAHKHRIQEIIGFLLYYARAVDNKLLVPLSAMQPNNPMPLLPRNKQSIFYLIMLPHIQMMALFIVLVT